MEIAGDKMSLKCMNMYDFNCVAVVLTFYNLASVFYLRWGSYGGVRGVLNVFL